MFARQCLVVAFFLGSTLATRSVTAVEPLVTITAVADPPATSGIDAPGLRRALADAVDAMDRTQLRRPVAVSFAVLEATAAPASCAVTAVVHDRKTGAMIGIAEGRSSLEAASTDARQAVARAAARRVVSRIPDVVSAAATK